MLIFWTVKFEPAKITTYMVNLVKKIFDAFVRALADIS